MFSVGVMGKSDTEAGGTSSTQPYHIVWDSSAQLQLTQKLGKFSGILVCFVYMFPHLSVEVILLEMPEKDSVFPFRKKPFPSMSFQ